MRTGLLLFSLCALSCSALKSDLTIQPGKAFLLGGNRNGAFTVQLQNRGKVSVTVTEKFADGQTRALAVFGPGESQSVRFANGSAALLRNNDSLLPVRLFLVVTGDKNLSMQSK